MSCPRGKRRLHRQVVFWKLPKQLLDNILSTTLIFIQVCFYFLEKKTGGGARAPPAPPLATALDRWHPLWFGDCTQQQEAHYFRFPVWTAHPKCNWIIRELYSFTYGYSNKRGSKCLLYCLQLQTSLVKKKIVLFHCSSQFIRPYYCDKLLKSNKNAFARLP